MRRWSAGNPHPQPAAFACFLSCGQVKSSVNLSRVAKLNSYLYSLDLLQSPYRRMLQSRITPLPWSPLVLTASLMPLDFHDLGSLVVLKNVPFGVALLFSCLVRGCEFGREVTKEDHSQPIRSGSHVIDIT